MFRNLFRVTLVVSAMLTGPAYAADASTTPVPAASAPAPAASGVFSYSCLPSKPSDVEFGTTFDTTGASLGVWAYWFCPNGNFEWRATPIANINDSVLQRFKAYRDGKVNDVFTKPTLGKTDPTIAPMYADILHYVALDVNNPVNIAKATGQIRTNGGLCLAGPSPITTQTCSTAANQKWDMSTVGKIAQSGVCLGMNGTANGTTASFLSCVSASTTWVWTAGSAFKHTATGKCLTAAANAVGVKPVLLPCDGSPGQIFH